MSIREDNDLRKKVVKGIKGVKDGNCYVWLFIMSAGKKGQGEHYATGSSKAKGRKNTTSAFGWFGKKKTMCLGTFKSG